MKVTAQQTVSIRNAHREAHTPQDRQVHDVVADVADLLVFQASGVKHLLVWLQFFQRALLDEMEAKFFRPKLHHRYERPEMIPVFSPAFWASRMPNPSRE